MTEWFECKVKYDKTMEDGLIKSTTETYLVDAISFSEAEKRFIEEIEPYMAGEFVVTDIKRARLAELMESEDLTDDKWYKARVAYITIDEKKGTEKRAVQSILIQAKQDLPLDVQLVAVSKFHPSSMIEDAYAGGQRLFGENHVQELQQKHEVLPKDIEWHFIGHLQTNKVKYIAPYVHLIHAVDTHKLLQEINKQAEKNNRIIDCLLELHIAQEETKYGFSVDELYNYVKQGEWKQLNNVRICGLMCMASNVEDEAQIASEFQKAEKLFNTIKKEFFTQQDYFTIRSWGMSDDYPIAVKYGSNMVRIGSKIFGPRVC